MTDLALCLAGTYAIPAFLFLWLYWETKMASMTATEQATVVNKLTEAGCPDELKQKLVKGGSWAVIQKILAFIAAHPALAAEVWTFIQDLISGGGLPAGV